MADSRPDLTVLRRQLRARLQKGEPTLALSAAEVTQVLEELGRLQQSNDRLRRQNRRVRQRLLAAGGEVDAADVDGDEAAAPETPAGDSEEP